MYGSELKAVETAKEQVMTSEFRRSLQVLHTRTDVRVDTRTSGDVEFLVPRLCTELVMYLQLGFSSKHFVTLN